MMDFDNTGWVLFLWLKIQGLSRSHFPFFKDAMHFKIKRQSAAQSSECAYTRGR